MGGVRVLPPELVSKIAAGEVIERPASVVKELVENSLDAGAKRVRVELVFGGKRLVRVTDDGSGMSPEDAELAIRRHATSKISSEEDLQRITTLGFRGEALAAMAEVSRLTLMSKAEGHPGVRLVVEAGQIREKAEVGFPKGTQVEVKDLFFNLPARRKFLKAPQTELGHATEAVVRMALVHPEVSFLLEHEGREVLHLQPSSGAERVAAVMGREVYPHLREVGGRDGPFEVTGWVSLPPYARGNTRGIYLYVNRRYVRDRLLGAAVGEVYGRLLPRGAWPVAVLFLHVPPEEVDVNIHPTKMEVRFRHPEEVYRLLRDAMEEVLVPASVSTGPVGTVTHEVREAPTPYSIPPSLERPEAGGQLRPLGQIDGTYILAEGERGLMVVDQHAAHERVLYERLKHGRFPVQRLLLPAVVEFSGEEMEMLLRRRDELFRLGFELEPFGPKSVAVKSVPGVIRAHQLKETLQGLASEIRGDDPLERALVFLACRGALKASTPLSQEEMGRLLKELFSTSHPRTCPHGRPTFVEITAEELSRRFGRG